MSNDSSTITIPMLLDTGTQITTLSDSAKALVTAKNSVISGCKSISATGDTAANLTQVSLTTKDGSNILAYYSPKFTENLLSLNTVTQNMGKVVLISAHDTYLVDQHSNLAKKWLSEATSNPEIIPIKNKESLIPVKVTFQQSQRQPHPSLFNWQHFYTPSFKVNKLTTLPLLTELPQNPETFLKGWNYTDQDLKACHAHDFYHYKESKLSKLLMAPISPLVRMYIKKCPTCLSRPLTNKSRTYRNPDDPANSVIPHPRIIDNRINENFNYSIHLDTLKMDTKVQSPTVKSILTMVIKPHNYVKLFPRNMVQPSQELILNEVASYLISVIGKPPTSITTDRGNEFNSLHQWAIKNNIQSFIAATGDSQFNGVVERFNKEIALQYGLLTCFIPIDKIQHLNHILINEIMNRLNSDRRSNSHSPNNYIFGKDVSPAYINKGIPLFSDVRLKTSNAELKVGLHLGYHFTSNRAIVKIDYNNNVPYSIQPLNERNIDPSFTYTRIKAINSEILPTPEFKSLCLQSLESNPMPTPSQIVFTNVQPFYNNITVTNIVDSDITLNDSIKKVHFNKMLPQDNIASSPDLTDILERINQDKPIPLKIALQQNDTRDAMKIEIEKWMKANAISPYKEKHTDPRREYATTFWIYTAKAKESITIKARLITIILDTVHTKILPEHYSPVSTKTSIQGIIYKALKENTKLATLDVSGAFLQAKTSHQLLLLKAPPGFNELAKEIDPSFETAPWYKVEKALYGLKDSPLQWNKTFLQHLYEDNFHSSLYDQCLLHHKLLPNVAMTIHVDDVLYTLNKEDDVVLNTLKKRKINTTSNSSDTFDYLGLTYKQLNNEVQISIFKYLKKSADKNIKSENFKPRYPLPTYFTSNSEFIKALHNGLIKVDYSENPIVSMPPENLTNFSKHNKEVILADFTHQQQIMNNKARRFKETFSLYEKRQVLYIRDLKDYQKYLGVVGYITSTFRFDLSIYHATLSSFNTKYSEYAAYALQHLVAFIYQSPNVTQSLKPIKINNDLLEVTTYTDANWSRLGSSYSGTVITFGGQIVYTKTSKQEGMATSAYIAELKAIYFAVIQTYETVIRYKDIIHHKQQVIRIKCDNVGVIQTITHNNALSPAIVANQLSHQILFLREEFNKGRFNIEYIPSKENPADLFTKPLGGQEYLSMMKLPLYSNHIIVDNI